MNNKIDETGWRGDGIRLFSGVLFYPLEPRIEEIELIDIAHSLSLMNRFAGHTIWPYSVAQHAVMVSEIVEQTNPELAFEALHHDDSEAYLVDLPRPLKHSGKLDAYKFYEEKLEAMIAERFDLVYPMPAVIKQADTRALVTEQRDLFPMLRDEQWVNRNNPLPEKITPWQWNYAEERFLQRHHELLAARDGAV